MARLRTQEIQTKSNINTYDIWKSICEISKKSYDEIYKKLNININEIGESFYHKFIENLIDELKEKKNN